MSAAVELAVTVGVAAACASLGVARATYYRHAAPDPTPHEPRPTPARTLTADERAVVLAELSSPRFVDLAPREVYARLLDEHRYLCSISTMYRVLAAAGATRERRDVLHHPSYAKPELIATAPNQLCLVVGHHQAARAAEGHVLLPVRRPRPVQPLRGRLDARTDGERPPRRRAH
jgi:putative transposase